MAIIGFCQTIAIYNIYHLHPIPSLDSDGDALLLSPATLSDGNRKEHIVGPMMQAMAKGLRFSNFTLNLITRDLKEEDAHRRSRGDEGPSLVWVIGHLINSRYGMMKMLGADKTSPVADTFGRDASDGADYPTIAELVEIWNKAAEELDGVMASVTDKQLMSAPEWTPPHGEKTILDTFSFLVWHESYHFGQMGTLRTNMGYTSTAELAVKASKGE